MNDRSSGVGLVVVGALLLVGWLVTSLLFLWSWAWSGWRGSPSVLAFAVVALVLLGLGIAALVGGARSRSR
jgi:hypothetical protein